jgi:LemA protein
MTALRRSYKFQYKFMNKKWLFGCGGLALIVGIIAVVVVLVLSACVGINNEMVKKSQAVDGQWAQVQNVYQRRSDLIPSLVATVQGAADFEKGTLEAVAQARASIGQIKLDPSNAPATLEQIKKFQDAQTGLSSALSRLLVVAERYPDLKANANFQNLQAQLEGTENRISVERMRFNEVTQDYNAYIAVFPNSFIANFRNFTAKPYFQAEEKAQKAPEVKFDFKK